MAYPNFGGATRVRFPVGARYQGVVHHGYSGKSLSQCTHKHKTISKAVECAEKTIRKTK